MTDRGDDDPSSCARPLTATAAERNKGPILDVLARALPQRGLVCEIASGTGQHVVHFARALPRLVWQPSDPDSAMRASISAWTAQTGLANVLPPLDFDVRAEWPIARADALVCINMVHISPWTATVALMAGAGRVLGQGGVLYLYGPYRQAGRPTAPSNEAFDAMLRAQNPDWGLRDLEAVESLAAAVGLRLDTVTAMPANNLSAIFRKT